MLWQWVLRSAGCNLAGLDSVVISCGSVLGPVLFHIFNNNLVAGVQCTISTFAGDTRLGGAVGSLEGQEAL